jgi:hypothetical protein
MSISHLTYIYQLNPNFPISLHLPTLPLPPPYPGGAPAPPCPGITPSLSRRRHLLLLSRRPAPPLPIPAPPLLLPNPPPPLPYLAPPLLLPNPPRDGGLAAALAYAATPPLRDTPELRRRRPTPRWAAPASASAPGCWISAAPTPPLPPVAGRRHREWGTRHGSCQPGCGPSGQSSASCRPGPKKRP